MLQLAKQVERPEIQSRDLVRILSRGVDLSQYIVVSDAIS
ncbi:hypothetical protein PPIS_a3140 [Pseudoalteromonas piscicida]|uniref:Uncharacterized protein n=1 Tax=Pseudoalteromonas piscicida TaxID=43662 RepID=A0ABM6NGV2_PSEO7|nr:hypothetical protein PPIS_a3140 [Pseudoalteromonas piscicida]MBE0374460.1 hypothetical protein [Pseudoalteromonas flavipulchra NCIMB 2033 = ATCC BAA-314]